ncbi:Nitrogen assimilation transcription factor nirA [Aspergillus nidulans FGSC A4] [Rhizoctonia solani]|uniref:Nitrogen assimilation transcription factor nirA [Aspergillus nidulans FGSC A4] n=1 Tax=Rhizoctonia solani TaxID=456999 RepID=A0A0K6FNJ3_9AGAM|nr:Nitrogen assimilation transcription factor nirA [Aspergillus nidulans FGSC A4] [Rhizoctonia solani]
MHLKLLSAPNAMSHSEASPSRRRRQYVSQACNSCRRRRCKCDGVQPQCGPCSSSGHECTWGAEAEESGRPATKQLVESLRVKVQHLESELMQIKQEQNQTQSALSTPIHPSTSLADPSSAPIEPVWSVTTGDSPQTSNVGQILSELHLQSPPHPQTLLGISHPVQPVQLVPVEDSVASLPLIAPYLKYQYIFNIDTTLPLDEHYPSHRASLTCHWNRYLPNLSPIQLSRFEHDTILFRLFSYGASCSFGLLPDLFLAELLQYLAPETAHIAQVQGSRYYAPILHCSLMAFGAAFSDSPEIRSNDTRAKFARHAKGWLDEEFSHPGPSLMVSLALLSEYHSGIGERNTGHMYMGKLFDLSSKR